MKMKMLLFTFALCLVYNTVCNLQMPSAALSTDTEIPSGSNTGSKGSGSGNSK